MIHANRIKWIDKFLSSGYVDTFIMFMTNLNNIIGGVIEQGQEIEISVGDLIISL